MSDLPARLRSDLTAAMRARDREAVRVLRTVLSAIANAEAQPVEDPGSVSLVSDGPIAGAALGLGAAEVARRALDENQVREVIAAERDERLQSADVLKRSGAGDAAEAVRGEAALLEKYLS